MSYDELEFVEELSELLRTRNAVSIKYRKIDGTERVVKATLKSSLVPQTKGAVRTKPLTCLVVWDTEKNEWRSLLKSNILEFSA